MTKVAINGMGRIGRAALKTIREIPDLELAAVNDLMPVFKEIEAYCYAPTLINLLKIQPIRIISKLLG